MTLFIATVDIMRIVIRATTPCWWGIRALLAPEPICDVPGATASPRRRHPFIADAYEDYGRSAIVVVIPHPPSSSLSPENAVSGPA